MWKANGRTMGWDVGVTERKLCLIPIWINRILSFWYNGDEKNVIKATSSNKSN